MVLRRHPGAFPLPLPIAATGYSGLNGAYQCPEAPETCCGPDPWYADADAPLGAPLGPAVRSGNVYTRHFEHAVSVLNLDDPDASSVTFTPPRP